MSSYSPIPACRDFQGFRAGSLWSLFEMLKIDAGTFYKCSAALTSTREILEGVTRHRVDFRLDRPILDINIESFTGTITVVCQTLESMGLNISLMCAQRAKAALEERPLKLQYQEYKRLIEEIDSRLRDELSLIHLYVLAPDKQKYFSLPTRASSMVDKLPKAIPDLEDSGKCISLNQGTASVYHSMRVLESALKALATLLGIPYAPSWESYITQIETKIGQKHKKKTISWKRDEAFFRDVLGDLQAIKIAWRNPTMHIVRRYSIDEAEQIYNALLTFLDRLVPRLPDQK